MTRAAVAAALLALMLAILAYAPAALASPTSQPASQPTSQPTGPAAKEAPTSQPTDHPADHSAKQSPTSHPTGGSKGESGEDDSGPLFYDPDAETGRAGPPEPSSPAAKQTGPSAPRVSKKKKKSPKPSPDLRLDTVSIFGRRADRARIAGSAHVVGKKELERFEYDDIQRVLEKVPGVYVRGEDGFGLRPNIGMRGASSDRSAKITLMEDGILLAPAPYSAPAAYYFPLVTQMTGIEVFKGPASIRHGPNTIGGAINLRTRAIPREMEGNADVALGRFGYGKVNANWGMSGKRWGVLADGTHLQSSGFKQLDGGGNTGFSKNQVMLKARYHADPSASFYYQIDAKGGFANERSNETYLGLSDNDFAANPRRRYAATQNGVMRWWRTQAQLGLFAAWRQLDVQVTGYRNDFSRTWTKLNRFAKGPSLPQILADPSSGQTGVYHAVLTGAQDSSGPDQTLLIGSNARRFVSEGVAIVGHWRAPKLWRIRQRIELGARLHYDEVVRDQTEDGFLMRSGKLVPDGRDTATVVNNLGGTYALALHMTDELRFADLLLTPGVRLELIRRRYIDYKADTHDNGSNVVPLPGVGAFYQIAPWIGVLGGVHMGFSPVAPGQAADVKPERSVNYEAGSRVKIARTKTKAEVVGFFNDYSNLVGACSLCEAIRVNKQFNGGAVNVYGLEASVDQRLRGPWGLQFSANASYTLTLSRFRSGFDSANPQFGHVEVGDQLAYVPVHQASTSLGVAHRRWSAKISGTYVGTMRDTAGHGPIPDGKRIDGRFVLDLAGQFAFTRSFLAYLTINNLLNTQYMLSRRPFGARPGLPFMLQAGLKYRIGS